MTEAYAGRLSPTGTTMVLHLLAEGETWFVPSAAAAAVASILTALGFLLAKYLPEVRKSNKEKAAEQRATARAEAVIRRDAYEAATASFQGMFDRQEEQINRLSTTMLIQDRSIKRLYDLNAECREESAEMLGFTKLIYSILQQNHATLVSAGMKPEPLLPMPDFDGRREQQRARETEFIKRSSEQVRDVVSAAGDSLRVEGKNPDVHPPGSPAG